MNERCRSVGDGIFLWKNKDKHIAVIAENRGGFVWNVKICGNTIQRSRKKLAVRYRKCLDQSKTERECVALSIAMAEEHGYKNIEDCIREGITLKAGDKVYAQYMKKTLALFHIGTKPMTEGMNILGAHVDSPRLDVKQNPLYEDTQMAYLDTHYYGGVKKYQWVTIPLAIHGVVVKKDGTVVPVVIGEKEDDPVFVI